LPLCLTSRSPLSLTRIVRPVRSGMLLQPRQGKEPHLTPCFCSPGKLYGASALRRQPMRAPDRIDKLRVFEGRLRVKFVSISGKGRLS
jgi:hypothetical protein